MGLSVELVDSHLFSVCQVMDFMPWHLFVKARAKGRNMKMLYVVRILKDFTVGNIASTPVNTVQKPKRDVAWRMQEEADVEKEEEEDKEK